MLTERDNENKATLTAQKQRLMRLRAALAKSQAEYESSDKRYKDRNALLTQDFQRITRQYRELQGKYKHFEIADAHRHAEVTSLHQEELGAMVERLVAADRVITEQLLGWTWVPVAPAATLQIGSARGTTALGSDPASSASPEFPEPAADAFVPSSVEEAYPVARVMASDAADTEIDAQQSVQGADATTAAALPRYKLRGMLALIVQECGRFLLDRSVIAACERLESADDRKEDLAAVVRADAVLHAIGCTSVSAAASLLQVCNFKNGLVLGKTYRLYLSLCRLLKTRFAWQHWLKLKVLQVRKRQRCVERFSVPPCPSVSVADLITYRCPLD